MRVRQSLTNAIHARPQELKKFGLPRMISNRMIAPIWRRPVGIADRPVGRDGFFQINAVRRLDELGKRSRDTKSERYGKV